MKVKLLAIDATVRKAIVCGVLILAIAAASARGQEAIETDDIAYRKVNGRELLIDIERPKPEGVPRPAVVFLCGNGWGCNNINRDEFAYALDLAVQKGYVGITVDYSSVRENTNKRAIGAFPAQVYDVKSAIRFLKANAEQYDIDPNRIGVIGHSSGGTLALLLALTEPSDGLEGEDSYSNFSSTLRAVVNFAGPTDMVMEHHLDPKCIEVYMGGTPEAQPDLYRKASPIAYVRPGKPPILTIQGDQDFLIEQVVLFDKKMQAAGGTHALIIKKGAGHMNFDTEDKIVWDFLDRELEK